jgi:hypothetical protein
VTAGTAAARGVEGIVVVVEEVPARDVVDVAVRVGVGAVREGRDQVGAVEDRIRLGIARVNGHPRIGRVVHDVEGAVAVAVVVRARAAIAVLGHGKLVPVQVHAVPKLLLLPADPRVQDRDRDLRVSNRVLPGRIGADAGDLRAGRVAGGDVGVASLLIELGAVGVLRLDARRLLRGVRAEAEQAERLLEVAVAVRGRRVGVVNLAAVELGIVRGVGAGALRRIRSGERRHSDAGYPQRDRCGHRGCHPPPAPHSSKR